MPDQNRRSLRLEPRGDGGYRFPLLPSSISGPQKAPRLSAEKRGFSSENLPQELEWARRQGRGPSYRVLVDRSISDSGVYKCGSERAARDVETIANAIQFLETIQRHDEVVVHVTASAPRALDGDKVDHVQNVERQFGKKLHNAGRQVFALRVVEDETTGYHGHIVGLFPRVRLRLLFDLAEQEDVCRYNVKDGKAVDIKIASEEAGGIGHLTGYLCKTACTKAALYLGGSRVGLTGALAKEMTAWGLHEPRKVEYVRRGLPRAPKEKPDMSGQGLCQDFENGLFGPLPEMPVPQRPSQSPKRPKMTTRHAGQLALPCPMAPTAIDLLHVLGCTDREIGGRVGLSRPQVTNARNRQFGLSRLVVRRVLKLALAA